MITYKPGFNRWVTRVYLAGKMIGTILEDEETGFRYYPKGSKNGGEAFPTLAECKRSLEQA